MNLIHFDSFSKTFRRIQVAPELTPSACFLESPMHFQAFSYVTKFKVLIALKILQYNDDA